MSDTNGLSPDFMRRVCDEYLNATFVESFTHGMYTFVFTVALTKLFSKHSTQKRAHRNFLLAVLFLMYTLATVHLAFRWKLVRSAFVIHGPEHLYVYMAFASRNTLPARATYSVTLSINILIADCIMIWRCWTFWDHKWRMIILPVFCTIGGTIFNVLYIIQNLDALGTQPFQDVISGTNWAIAYYSMTLSTTVICTALILYPMLTTEAPTRGPRSNLYTYCRIIAIITESSALYALTLILFLVYLVRNDLTAPYPQVMLSSVTGIAPTLIVARVALGQTRPEDPRRSVITRGSPAHLRAARTPMQTTSFKSREALPGATISDKSNDTLS
ncbi:hypothetical protein DFS33DRAFT_1309319 [Desarmillaria ectypa]|nr:hypothetical protein DFS33DRAFT_1309319 [Desarmillaria ectypa]